MVKNSLEKFENHKYGLTSQAFIDKKPQRDRVEVKKYEDDFLEDSIKIQK